MSLVQEIDALLPQTQCGACGYAGCRPYAQALASQQADINLCPPGGVKTLKALGQLLKKDWRCFVVEMEKQERLPQLAKIDEKMCIGCTKCIKACPVDAIIGASKHMHHIIEHECTGCGLCVEPCPMDCIEMVTLDAPQYHPDVARERYESKLKRLDEEQRLQQVERLKNQQPHGTADSKIDYIQQALHRVKQKKSND
ncbi:MAG: RnfABCDGE type electron transport complex subunit B [Gammaproteobacteria bacterium]|nr:RnfABCDGE type electron transport complex subunit B [Gammaproteobacteria bacterium]